MRRAVFALLPLAAVLSACSLSPQLKRVAVDHNQMVADASNEIMLRNILRASKRYPLHFTAISEVNGGATVAAEIGVSPTINREPVADVYGLASGASISSNPSFKMGVLDTEKFQRGIQAPISQDLVAYYLDAGWPDQLIFSLFVERIDFYDADDPNEVAFATILNEPEKAYGFGSFLCDFALSAYKTRPGGTALGAPSQFVIAGTGGTAADAKARLEVAEKLLAMIKSEGVELDDKDQLYRHKPAGEFKLYLQPLENARCSGNGPPARLPGEPDPIGEQWRLGAKVLGGEVRRNDVKRFYLRKGQEYDLLYFYDDELKPDAPAHCRSYGEKTIVGNPAEWARAQACFNPGPHPVTHAYRVHDLGAKIQLRSVVDVIYFLGEYVRESGKDPANVYLLPRNGPSMDRVIEVLGGAGTGSLLSTSIDGETYHVPASGAGERSRSLQVVTIAQQLLNLHKSADSLPRSISVTGF